ncbi:tRNA (adenosine(37)-N6)-threonylcarbamoyltransferase complex ATPase subunit type 1 TsaE [Candidatus Saccharibacteria bacterium]|nr:tRNA (adenosine(37)-N6)-threonylcarbamoyltransferase complex ATPase subunit type 1 TsaE [Candidatus Saccharibacteria bacterium]
MIFKSEEDLTSFAENFGLSLKSEQLPLCLELVGDVGAGKTTFTRALARGLGITEPVTSPSFTISKKYYWSAEQISASSREATSVSKNLQNSLVHYDFYRLDDPGLMAEDLAESLADPHTLTILEWANTVKNILPKNHQTITFKVLENGNRELIFNDSTIWGASCSEISPNPHAPAVKTTTIHRTESEVTSSARYRTERCSFDDCERRTRTNSELEAPNASSIASEHQTLSLYLDTSDFTAKITLTDKSGRTFTYEDDLGREMAEKLLKTLKTHLEEHGKSFKDLKKITFMSGPGSFTGLRIGACIVNTLSHELDIPLYDHKGVRRKIILPDYGRPANITPPKK